MAHFKYVSIPSEAKAISHAVHRTVVIVNRMTLRNRLHLALKGLALVVIALFMIAGHLPSGAQTDNSPKLDRGQEVSAEDVRQDTQITYIQAAQAASDTKYEATQVILTKQGEDIARLDTKMTLLVGFLGLLQTGSIVLSVVPVKRKTSDATKP